MTVHLAVEWTVTAGGTPQPWLHCRSCGDARAFTFSGKARLNANGKRLDGWLIYRCSTCGTVWNRPVVERCTRAAIPRDLLDALSGNDPEPLLRIARDRASLARFTRHIDDGGAVNLLRRTLGKSRSPVPVLSIRISPSEGTAPRLDRILAAGLGVGRGRIAELAGSGRFALDGAALARPVRLAATLRLNLDGIVDADAILARAGGAGPSADAL